MADWAPEEKRDVERDVVASPDYTAQTASSATDNDVPTHIYTARSSPARRRQDDRDRSRRRRIIVVSIALVATALLIGAVIVAGFVIVGVDDEEDSG